MSGALGEGGGVVRQVKGGEAEFAPSVVRLFSADGAGDGFKVAALFPEFAVHRGGGEVCDEPFGGGEDVAVAGDEFVSVPPGADAVEFFADEVVGEVGVGESGVGEEFGESAMVFGGAGGEDGNGDEGDGRAESGGGQGGSEGGEVFQKPPPGTGTGESHRGDCSGESAAKKNVRQRFFSAGKGAIMSGEAGKAPAERRTTVTEGIHRF